MQFDIPMPDREEKEVSVSVILKKGLSKKENVFTLLRDMHTVFGFRNLFFGIGDCLYLTVLFAMLVYAAIATMARPVLHTAVFTASPILYLTAWLLSTWKEHLTDTLALQEVCKYTSVHITAVRMLCFGTVSLLADIPFVALSAYFHAGDFWKLLLLAFCSLFVYAVLLLIVLLYVKVRFAASLLPIVWLLLNLLPLMLLQEDWEFILQTLPNILLVLPILAFAVVYFILLNRYVRKGVHYADS